jgi:hypothetical protein
MVSQDDLFELAEWKAQDPDVPDGDWYKDFGTFKLCGKGKFPSTFLTAGQSARGKRPEASDCDRRGPRCRLGPVQYSPGSRRRPAARESRSSLTCSQDGILYACGADRPGHYS